MTPTEWFREHNPRAHALIGLDRSGEAVSEVADAPDGVDIAPTRMLAHLAAGDRSRADRLASQIIDTHGATENWARSADAVLVRILVAVADADPTEADHVVWPLHLADPARAVVARAATALRIVRSSDGALSEWESADLTETVEGALRAADPRWAAIDHALAISWARVTGGAQAAVAARGRTPESVADDPWVAAATNIGGRADGAALLQRLATVIATAELSSVPADAAMRERQRNTWMPPFAWLPVIGAVTGLALLAPWWLALIVLVVGGGVTAFALWVRTPGSGGVDDGLLARLDPRLPSAWRVTAIGLACAWAPLAVAALPAPALRVCTVALALAAVGCALIGFARSTSALGEWDAREEYPAVPISQPVDADTLRVAVSARRGARLRSALPTLLVVLAITTALLIVAAFGPGFGAAVAGLFLAGTAVLTLASRRGRTPTREATGRDEQRPPKQSLLALVIIGVGGLGVAVTGLVHIFTSLR